MTVKAKKLPVINNSNCNGCRNNFYNHSGNSSTGQCWSFETARMRYRWAINMQAPMGDRHSFRKVRVPDCFHGEGPYRDIYLRRLPAHFGSEWADKREEKECQGQ